MWDDFSILFCCFVLFSFLMFILGFEIGLIIHSESETNFKEFKEFKELPKINNKYKIKNKKKKNDKKRKMEYYTKRCDDNFVFFDQ
jgi:hypothetical protein